MKGKSAQIYRYQVENHLLSSEKYPYEDRQGRRYPHDSGQKRYGHYTERDEGSQKPWWLRSSGYRDRHIRPDAFA